MNESRGKDPATWDEVLLDVAEVYENYTLVSTNHLQEFISFNEPYIESVTGHYACAVSALLACGAYYNAVDYTDIAGDYMDIWDSTGTTVSSESGGITYGSTTIGNIGPGFVDFCAGKNVSVTQNTDYSPNYNFFTNCIDRGDIAVVHCGIISSDTPPAQRAENVYHVQWQPAKPFLPQAFSITVDYSLPAVLSFVQTLCTIRPSHLHFHK